MHEYGDVVLCLAHSDNLEVILTIIKVSCGLLLGQNLLNTISLAKKGEEVFF